MTAMTAIPPAYQRPPRRFRWGLVLLGVFALMCLAVAAAVIVVLLSFRMSGETRALRNTVFAAAPGQWEREVEFGLGRLPVLLAQGGLGMLDLEPEARLGLQAFHSGSVGVYRRARGVRPLDGADLLHHARERMHDRGWEPVVSVADGDDVVLIFVEPDSERATRLTACVMVASSDELVLVSGEVRLEPIFELVRIAVEKVDARTLISEAGLSELFDTGSLADR